eukprot:scaffold15581_cov85-Skeletonema_dohrnii-CCMP3373.AAC.3
MRIRRLKLIVKIFYDPVLSNGVIQCCSCSTNACVLSVRTSNFEFSSVVVTRLGIWRNVEGVEGVEH